MPSDDMVKLTDEDITMTNFFESADAYEHAAEMMFCSRVKISRAMKRR
jgi:hypothetical protein